MADDREPGHGTDAGRETSARQERWELLWHVQAILEPAMAALGLVFLALLLVDFAGVDPPVLGASRVDIALQVIWGVFVVDFAVRLFIAPDKVGYLRANWLGALSLALPFLRPLRAFRAARALRSLSFVRFLGGINRGMRVLRRITRGRQFAWVGVLTLFVVLAGAVGVRYFDRGIAGAPIQTFADALWWSAAMVTTINNETYVVSGEARTIAILQRVFAVSVFGYITASIASYLIGSDASREMDEAGAHALREEIVALRSEIAALRRSGAVFNQPEAVGATSAPEPASGPADPTHTDEGETAT